MTAVLTPEPVNIQFPDGIRVQDDLTLQTVVIDGNRQKLEERIDRDDHGQRLCIQPQLGEQNGEADSTSSEHRGRSDRKKRIKESRKAAATQDQVTSIPYILAVKRLQAVKTIQ